MAGLQPCIHRVGGLARHRAPTAPAADIAILAPAAPGPTRRRARATSSSGAAGCKRRAIHARAASGEAAAPAAQQQREVQVCFSAAAGGISVAARAGEPLADVATRAGVDSIQYGCHAGSCGVCEVELRRFGGLRAGKAGSGGESGGEGSDNGGGGGGSGGGGGGSRDEGTTAVVRACVAVVPADCVRVEVDLMDDGIWGVDGFDT